MTRPGSPPSRRLSTENARRLRATALALALSVLLLAGGLGYALHESWLRHLEADQQRISDVTAAAAASLQRRIDAVSRALVDLSVVAGDAFTGATPRGRDGLHARLQELNRANSDVNRFGIRDAEGVIVASSERVMRGAASAAGLEFFEAHRTGGASGLVISSPIAQFFPGITIIALSRGVRDADGRFLGVVVATLPSALLLDDVAGLRRLPTQLALMRDDGVVLHLRGTTAIPDDASSRRMHAVLQEAAVGRRTVEDTLDGRPGQLAWQSLQGHPLKVVASVARADLVDGFLRDVRLSFLIAGSILIVVGALAVWLIAMMRSHLLRLEAESRSLEARFRDGIESMADGVLLYDSDDRLLAWNRRFFELMPHRPQDLFVGITGEEILRLGFRSILPDADAAEVSRIIESRMRARRSLEGTELRTLNGRVIEVTDRRTSDGGMISIFRDVTDERRLIEQLSLSEGRFRDFASTSSDWFWETDAEHRLTYVSHGIRALGLPTASMVGDPLADLGGKLGRAVFAAEAGARLTAQLDRREAFRDLELAAVGAGADILIEIAGKPIFDGRQRFAGFRGGARDVTEIRRIHRRLAENEARTRDYAEAGSDWMWETDAAGRFTYVSEGVRRFGTAPEAFVDRALDALPWRVSPDAPGVAALAAAMASHSAFHDVVLPASLQGGQVSQIAMTGWPLRDAAGGFSGYRGIGRDITENVRQRAEVERALISEREANAQQRRFISIASHEFRTPLAVIDSATQRLVVMLPEGLPAEIGKRLMRIRSAVARMTQIIDRTLASARLDEGRIEFKPETFDLAALLRELCERQRSIAPQFEIACDAPASFDLDGDPRLIDQIFTNLLSNAVKYSGAARRVEVTLAADADACRVSVCDRGIGIDADDVAQLFQRFFRARSAEGVAGTGIGLHLVRELVRMHRGDVTVSSRIGEGSTFTVVLPRHAPAAFGEAAQ